MAVLREAANVAAKAAADAVGHGQREKYVDIMAIGIQAALDAGLITLADQSGAVKRLAIEHDEWVGVDFDCTLATYASKQFPKLGEPVPKMVDLVKDLHRRGIEVRIVTARGTERQEDRETQVRLIEAWCMKHLGFKLCVTDRKDYQMAVLFDDRCIQVEKNTGKLLGEFEIS